MFKCKVKITMETMNYIVSLLCFYLLSFRNESICQNFCQSAHFLNNNDSSEKKVKRKKKSEINIKQDRWQSRQQQKLLSGVKDCFVPHVRKMYFVFIQGD